MCPCLAEGGGPSCTTPQLTARSALPLLTGSWVVCLLRENQVVKRPCGVVSRRGRGQC